LNAKLEPFLGFLRSTAKGKPSFVCDLQELYRYLIDDFAIQFCHGLKRQDFILKPETFSSGRKGKREYLNDSLTRSLIRSLDLHFKTQVSVPRIRSGSQQEIETLICEEAFLFAQYLRDEKQLWNPRIVNLSIPQDFA
jgi:CRISPR/Cas system-associated endonuclease Cas1